MVGLLCAPPRLNARRSSIKPVYRTVHAHVLEHPTRRGAVVDGLVRVALADGAQLFVDLLAERFPRIVIVDDTTEARLLIRRILQSQGDFTLFEATNGKEALRTIRREKPDLIILDLMMPELDGFGVLDQLKADAETATIPVIVSTAKELTSEEKEKLKGQIQSLLQKGDFMSDEFLDEVHTIID